jgi:exodeoxyribonuclease V beta subunit
MARGPVPFSLTGPLPEGTLAIEASAGTGKTFALAALATRFIAEGRIQASELLIVTFTRAATGELRARVRDQLIVAAECLAGQRPVKPGEELLAHLVAADRPGRLDRVRRAIIEFDAATITTIHGFAAQVRGALGVSPDVDGDARLVDDTRDLIAETCADALIGAAVRDIPTDELPTLTDLRSICEQVVGRPDVRLVPTADDDGVTPAQRLLRDLVVWSVDEVAERRRRRGTVSFDDLLTQLRSALDGPTSAAVIDTVRSRFKVALIDEFQDTDSVQWGIFSTLFGHSDEGTTLVLVGDPKQAIYGFRGADIHTYLRAISEGSGAQRRSLVTNWRSDGAVLTSLAALFERATFGDEGIPFVPVEPAEPNRHRRLHDAGGGPLPALSLRLAAGPRIERYARSTRVQTSPAALAINDDLVVAVRRLLDGARIPVAGEGSEPRPVRPSDVAVLVGTRAQGEEVQAALLGHGVPAVLASGDSVLQSPAAEQMRYLLHAMDRPSDARRVRTFALSWFVGWRAEQVASASEPQLDAWQDQLRTWSDMLAAHSAADILARVWTESGVVPRVLRAPDGDRHLTDLDHLAELFHGATPGGLTSVARMLAFLDAEPETEADADMEGSVTARRIESEDEAVQVMTIWMAKGQEFPVVCLPSLWRPPRGGQPVTYVDRDSGDRTVDLTGAQAWPDKASAKMRADWAADEAMGEQLRLLYVALTRAQHHAIVWWANSYNSEKTALARVLFARVDGVIDPDRYGRRTASIPADADAVASLEALVGRAGGTIEVSAIDAPAKATPERWVDRNRGTEPLPLEFVPFDTALDRSAHRWSFSTITDHTSADISDPYDDSQSDGGAHDEPDDRGEASDQATEGLIAGPEVAGSAEPHPPAGIGPLAWLPAGTSFGTLVHAVLEDIDFAATDLEASLAAGIDRQLARRTVDLAPPAGSLEPESGPATDSRTAATGRSLLVDGLRAALNSPLGPSCDGLALVDVVPANRLNEMSFELRLAQAGHSAHLREVGAMMMDHLDDGDPLRPWATDVAGGVIDVDLSGHLTGSIDLIMRMPSGRGDERFVVADYKTNRLTPWGHPPGPGDYHPGRLARAMAQHDYPLQALLYSVALHRYLRWRLPDYAPDRHLGGVAYLFLRGMTGPLVQVSNGQPHGVFGWSVPPALVAELSDLLDGQLALGAYR